MFFLKQSQKYFTYFPVNTALVSISSYMSLTSIIFFPYKTTPSHRQSAYPQPWILLIIFGVPSLTPYRATLETWNQNYQNLFFNYYEKVIRMDNKKKEIKK